MPRKNDALKIETVKVTDLKPYENNPRLHSDEQIDQLAASIKEFGFTNPILIDKESEIIAGHGRLDAALQVGMKEVPAIRLGHLSEAQKRAYVIADNKLTINGGWNNHLLALEMIDIKDDIDLSLTGFSDDELADMFDLGGTEFPHLPTSEERQPYQHRNFVLHDEQAEIVKAAVTAMREKGGGVSDINSNRNGNAITAICQLYLDSLDD